MNWSDMSLVAKQIADANFFTAAFNHPNAFDKKITTEGHDERIYEIGQQPGPDIAAGFKACLESMK
jgi:hypothetical protein